MSSEADQECETEVSGSQLNFEIGIHFGGSSVVFALEKRTEMTISNAFEITCGIDRTIVIRVRMITTFMIRENHGVFLRCRK